MKTKIIPCVMACDGIVLNKVYIKELMITPVIEAYMQYIVIKKTIESISFNYRRVVEEGTRDRISNLCNTVEPGKVPEETKVEDKGNKKVVT